ncbi:hypothetical protein [Streptomyces wuyuanensis]
MGVAVREFVGDGLLVAQDAHAVVADALGRVVDIAQDLRQGLVGAGW